MQFTFGLHRQICDALMSPTWKLVIAKQLEEAAIPIGTVPGGQKKERLSVSFIKESKIAPDL